MGVSTDGILVFGINFDEDLPEQWQNVEDFDFDDLVLKEAGIEEWSENASDDYWKRYREAIALCPVDLVTHCSYEYPMYILAIRGTEKTAKRGYPEEIDQATLTVPQEKINAFNDWLDKHDIGRQAPKWFLCSLWG